MPPTTNCITKRLFTGKVSIDKDVGKGKEVKKSKGCKVTSDNGRGEKRRLPEKIL